MVNRKVKDLIRGFPPELVAVLKSLHPMVPISKDRLASTCYPGPGNTKRRNQSKRWLSNLLREADYFEPQGDQHGALAYFGYRWTALTVNNPPKRQTSQTPLTNLQLLIHFPDLKEKIIQLPSFVIMPNDLHEFLAGLYGWEPIPTKKRKMKCRRLSSQFTGEGKARVSMVI